MMVKHSAVTWSSKYLVSDEKRQLFPHAVFILVHASAYWPSKPEKLNIQYSKYSVQTANPIKYTLSPQQSIKSQKRKARMNDREMGTTLTWENWTKIVSKTKELHPCQYLLPYAFQFILND